MRNWLKSLIAEAVGEALTEQHKATLKPAVFNIQAGNTERAFREAKRIEDERDGS